MAAGESGVVFTPLCQGFLKKRKDKMRLKWVTYWFKLHNTTLFFYTKKQGSTSDLRGQYYLFEVESVREVLRSENKRYLFEITMKNGKRKVLAADTADLRQEWICQLLKAIKTSEPATTEPDSDWEAESNHTQRTQSSLSSSNSEWSGALVRPYSAMSDSCHWASRSNSESVTPETTPRSSTALGADDFESVEYSDAKVEEMTEELETEHEYDVLPTRQSVNREESIYDTPSNQRASRKEYEITDSIYDVPKSIFRKVSAYMNDGPCGEERPESVGLLTDMMACLGSESAAWVRAASQKPSVNLTDHSTNM